MSPEALRLIAASEAELAAIYPPEVRYAFSPEQLVTSDTRFLVGHLDAEPVACGGFAPCEGYAELKRIFVEKAHRNKGLAGVLVMELEKAAKQAGFHLMRLETGHDSPEAVHLYKRLGYKERPPFGDYQDNGSSVFMEKVL
jgi:putative acetyltransferase